MKHTFEISAEASQIPAFRENLRQALSEAGLDEKASGETVLAVDERLTNIIRHGNPAAEEKITIEVEDRQNAVCISIRDFGTRFDPTQVPDPELPREKPGGLGIFLTRQLMDEVIYDSGVEQGNLLHLIKNKTKTA